jgi:sigma-B regulation protein RsbU (phosphoserine phosphatase)
VEKPWENEQLLAKLRRQLESRSRERTDRAELSEAAATQRSLMPRELPQMPGYPVAAEWVPARQVGGDYLDVLRLADDRLALCIADVMGKGMPAALLMSNLQALVRSLAGEVRGPAGLATRVNRSMAANIAAGKFVTLFYAVVEHARGKLIYTNAGHHAPILVRSSGEVQRLAGSGTVLGVFPNWIYDQDEIDLAAGDRLVLFTDGIPEAENAEGEPFGEERLLDAVVGNRDLGAKPLQEAILRAVTRFAGPEPQDDVALVVLSVDTAG